MSKTPTAQDEYSYTLHMSGQASTLPPEDEDGVIARLHQAVFDVTGKRVEVKQRNPVGFVWGSR